MAQGKHEPDKRDLSQKRVVTPLLAAKITKRRMVWDTKITGLGLDLHPSGRRSWILFYRFAGQQHRVKLGDARIIAPETAVTRARAALTSIAQGADPFPTQEKPTRPATVTVAEAGESYLSTLDSSAKVKPSSWPAEARRIYDHHIKPRLGVRDVRDVTVRDVRAVHEALVETPFMANRVKAVISAIMSRAIEDGARPREMLNPATAVEDYPELARDRYLDVKKEEWTRTANAIKRLRAEYAVAPAHDTRRHQLDAMLLLALTGARLRAVLPRKWADVDWKEHALLVKPAHKGVDRIILGESAEKFLRDLFDARGAHGGYIFPGQSRRVGKRTARYERDDRPRRPSAPISSIGPMWTQFIEIAELTDFRPHDWRRTFATVATDKNVSDIRIGGLLGHVVPGIKQRYARRTDDTLRDAATTVSAEIARRLNLRFSHAHQVFTCK